MFGAWDLEFGISKKTMFYLKYRPRTIEEIDNKKVREIIGRILKTGQLSHAFLYVGQKGTGKTSTARIFTKAINCLNNKFADKSNKSFEPCNHCSNCQSIDNSSSVDIVELDAASNRGIDDIKNLIRESNFLPMTTRHRVFIIDEAHMITNEAFNALLKTLEEPPKSVIFILATTNKEKVPKTIISRCTLVNFGKASREDILVMLKRIIDQEKITIDDKLLKLIPSVSESSFRDAAKILEELVIQQKLTYDEGKNFLGVSRQNFLGLIEKQNLKEILSWLNDFYENGGSIKVLIEQTLEELRFLLLSKNGLKFEEEIKSNLTLKETLKLIKLLTEAYQNLRITPIESLPLETAMVEFYNLRSK